MSISILRLARWLIFTSESSAQYQLGSDYKHGNFWKRINLEFGTILFVSSEPVFGYKNTGFRPVQRTFQRKYETSARELPDAAAARHFCFACLSWHPAHPLLVRVSYVHGHSYVFDRDDVYYTFFYIIIDVCMLVVVYIRLVIFVYPSYVSRLNTANCLFPFVAPSKSQRYNCASQQNSGLECKQIESCVEYQQH